MPHTDWRDPDDPEAPAILHIVVPPLPLGCVALLITVPLLGICALLGVIAWRLWY